MIQNILFSNEKPTQTLLTSNFRCKIRVYYSMSIRHSYSKLHVHSCCTCLYIEEQLLFCIASFFSCRIIFKLCKIGLVMLLAHSKKVKILITLNWTCTNYRHIKIKFDFFSDSSFIYFTIFPFPNFFFLSFQMYK